MAFEVAKAAIQVTVITAIGGAVTYAWRRVGEDREKEEQRHAKLLAELDGLIVTYNRIKAGRRALKSLGLQNATGRFTRRQVKGFFAQMSALTDQQLELEARMREFGQARLFREDGRTGKQSGQHGARQQGVRQ